MQSPVPQLTSRALRGLLWVVVVGILFASSVTAAEKDVIEMNFPEEVELSVLVDYVSDRLGINILYDEQVANKRLTIKAPSPVPAGSLLELLENALAMKNLALVDVADRGWKRVVQTSQITSVTPAPVDGDAGLGTEGMPGSGGAQTRVFAIRHASPGRVDQIIKPFLTQPGGNSVVVQDHGLLIVSDLAGNLERIEALIELVDRPVRETKVEFVGVHYADAAELAGQVRSIMAGAFRGRAAVDPAPQQLEVLVDVRTNHLILIGPPELVSEAEKVARALDAPVSEVRLPFRFYRLKHTTASEMLETLRALQGGGDGLGILNVGSLFAPESTIPPESAPKDELGTGEMTVTDTQSSLDPAPTEGLKRTPGDRDEYAALTSAAPRVVADTHTNSIIVIGPPDVQRVYTDLIALLDKRRPQVLIEITLVALDTSEGFSLGVEIAQSDSISGGGDVITFSSFGLSTVNATTGALTLTPGVGFNGTIVNTDIADIVVRALKRSGRAEVVSAPKILVNDNEEGQLSSTAQEPYESVNASNTVATTSFGGFAEAGTTITVTPHISEGDFLRLEYSIELSSFSGERVENLPPPKQQNTVSSSVSIPDGDTIIVGGLRRADSSETVRAVPFLGEIPIVEYLFSDRTMDESESTLFVFIRPVILRDDTFADLKHLSQKDMIAAQQKPDLPSSEPMPVY